MVERGQGLPRTTSGERAVRIPAPTQTRLHDIHALHADIAKRFDVGEIVETPWGMDELYVFDPSGSLVKFGQPTDRFIPADAAQETPSD